MQSLVSRLRAVMPYPAVRAGGPHDPDLPVVWGDLLREQDAGGDPTRRWREALAAVTERQYAVAPPPALPAAFVLQWVLEVAAVPAAFAAYHAGHLLDPADAGLSFAVEPRQLYPSVVQLRRAAASTDPPEARLVAARAAYREPARQLALSYSPDVNLGRRQRLAMADDVWAAAVARAMGDPPPRRESCCFIYTLPGAHECAGCPRGRTAG